MSPNFVLSRGSAAGHRPAFSSFKQGSPEASAGEARPSAPAKTTAGDALTVVVAHSEELFRAGLVRCLEGHQDITVPADCSNNGDALAHCQTHSPLVLLCDGDCDYLPVQQLTRRLKVTSPGTRVLVIGRETDQEMVLRWGAWGVISRGSSGELFSRAVRIIADGQYWVGRDVLTQLAQKALNPESASPKPKKKVLSTREAEILQLVGAGSTNDQIAEALFIEPNTVRTHLRRNYQKLKVHDRTSAVVTASQNGYIQLPGR
jgi:two-component system response regulator DegU